MQHLKLVKFITMFQRQLHLTTLYILSFFLIVSRVAYQNGNVLPLPIDSVNDILDTRLLSRRRRRSRHVQNNKARKNFDIIAETAKKVVE